MNTTAFRPRNETAQDLKHEGSAQAIIARKWGYQIVKLSPLAYRVDWALFHPESKRVRIFAEYKRRDKRYDTLLLSASKIAAGRALADSFGCLFVIFVEWPEGLFFWTDDGRRFPLELRGRTDRGQNGDLEPTVMIPVTLFKEVTDR